MLFSLEMKDEEIADLLDKSVESIRMIRYRTKKELKEKGTHVLYLENKKFKIKNTAQKDKNRAWSLKN